MSSFHLVIGGLWHRQVQKRAWLRRLLGCTFAFFLLKGLVWTAIFGWVALRSLQAAPLL